MELKSRVMIQAAITLMKFVLTLPLTAVAQELRSEISVKGTGFFAKNSEGNGIQNLATVRTRGRHAA